MPEKISGEDKLMKILHKDPRYQRAAYPFTLEALENAVRASGGRRHVTGVELLDSVRKLAVERFGHLVKTVFQQWGVKETRDFGHIVFNMVNAGLLKKQESDSIDDFEDVYNFDEVFEHDLDIDIDWMKPA